MDVKKELENLTIMTNSKPDWKQELRNVLAEAVYVETGDGQVANWTIDISDERMKELEAMNLWPMDMLEGWND